MTNSEARKRQQADVRKEREAAAESAQDLYTLAEARREIQRLECQRHGHSWDVLSSLAGPEGIYCACGESYRVVRDTGAPS